MANRTDGSSALQDNDRDDFSGGGEVIDFDNYRKISDLNKTTVSSSREAIDVLEKLKIINGKIIKGSVLDRSIQNYLGSVNTDDISSLIKSLNEIEKLNTDDFNTSAVPEAKIKELVEEYEKYTEEKGLSDKEALDQIYKENKGKISSKEIENFVQKQRDIHQENIRKTIDERVSKIADELMKKNEDLRDKDKVEEIIKETILEEREVISEKLGKNSSMKKIELEIKDFTKKNKKIINDIKVDELGKKIKEEIYKENPVLSDQQKGEIKNYIGFAKKIYQSSGRIDKDMGEAIIYAREQGLGDGQISVGISKTESFLKLIENPEPVSDLIKEYKSIIDKAEWKLPVKIKECDNLDALLNAANKSEKFEKLIGEAQKIINWKETSVAKIAEKIGFDKVLINLSGKVLGQEFVQNSLIILSQKSLEEGSFTILQAFIVGGTGAVAVAAAQITANTFVIATAMARETMVAAQAALATATASGTATAAELAALTKAATDASFVFSGLAKATVEAAAKLNATMATAGTVASRIGTMAATGMIPIVGQILAALMMISAVLKPAFDKVKKILSDIGLNFTKGIKKFLEENFGLLGKAGSFVINLAEDIGIMIGAVFTTVVVGPILILFFGGFFGYQILMGNSVSSLVPPEEAETSTSIFSETPYISSSGPIVLPTVDPNQTVTGQMVVDMASSLLNKVCYWYGGGHQSGEPVKGIDTNWGTTKFGNNNSPSGSTRNVYGLDCSGFVIWTYHQLGVEVSGNVATIYAGAQNKNISSDNLQFGDIGVEGNNDHIGIFAGKDSSGNLLWIHDGAGGSLDICGGGSGFVKMGTYSRFTKFARIL
jgi:cell wall-associated NlpC family hydrolase